MKHASEKWREKQFGVKIMHNYLRRDPIKIGIYDDFLQGIILQTHRTLPLHPQIEIKKHEQGHEET